MIGLVQGDETFGVLGSFKDPGGIFDADHTVGGCVKN